MLYFWGVVLIGAALVFLAVTVRRVTVFEYQRGLRYTKGRFASVLEPGQYWIYRPRTTVHLIDARQHFVTISGQEVLSSDGVTVKVSLAARYEIADPAKAINEVDSYESALYLTLQVALRAIVGAVPIDELVEKRVDLGPRVSEESASAVAELGLRLIAVDVKDIMLSGEVKRLFTQVVKARKDGQAALELARGETAAMRNLANAAGLMEAHPALLQVRALQQLAVSSGNTLVLGLPSDSAVFPVASKQARQDAGAAPEAGGSAAGEVE